MEDIAHSQVGLVKGSLQSRILDIDISYLLSGNRCHIKAEPS